MEGKNEGQTPTELKIFDAAREVFHQKGFEGARMQEIADRAEINKSMLHYYYRSKDKLFEKVYQLSMLRVFPQIVALLNKDMPLEQKLRNFVDKYIEVIHANPDIPLFILHELNKNPARLQKFMLEQVGRKVRPFLKQLSDAAEEGRTADLPPNQLLINMISMMVFPFIGHPVIKVILEMDEDDFNRFMDERHRLLPDYIVGTILKNPDES